MKINPINKKENVLKKNTTMIFKWNTRKFSGRTAVV